MPGEILFEVAGYARVDLGATIEVARARSRARPIPQGSGHAVEGS